MYSLRTTLSWYKNKIGDHDKQSWEQSVEQRVFKTFDDLPKRDANQDRRELLDVDLIKGSAFTKAKPSHTANIRTWKGLVRLLFMPLFWRWWIQHTSKRFLAFALLLYIAQVCVSVMYCVAEDSDLKNNSLFEVSNPLILMFVLSVMHTQIVFTQSTQQQNRFKKPRLPVKHPNSKHSKKRPPPPRRKAKSSQSSTVLEGVMTSKPAKPKKIVKGVSSDSSDVDDKLLQDGGLAQTDDMLEMDDILLSSEESVAPDTPLAEPSPPSAQQSRPHILIDRVPDVAVHAAEQHRSENISQRTERVQRPTRLTEGNALVPPFIGKDTTEQDSPVITSDTEWEHNRVYSSDVACGSDSSTEYETQDEDDEPSKCPYEFQGPIRLEREDSHSMGYVPSAYDKMSCVIWEENKCKKVDLSVIDLGGLIESRCAAEDYEPSDSFYIGIVFTCLIACFPILFRTYHSPRSLSILSDLIYNRTALDYGALYEAKNLLLGTTWQEVFITANGMIQRFLLCGLFSFLVMVAESSYFQRLQYAKYFSYLTSSRRSRKYDVPHFRLNKVKNIKIWLSLRAYLKKRGPQRSVEVIITALFILMVVLLALMCVQLLQDVDHYLLVYGNWELTICCLALAVHLLRFYSLGTKITKKYRNLSTLITEQINLYLHMEQKPDKKDELLLANAVLKLAEGLIKELESPYKLFNAMVNPVVFNVTRLVVLSAFSAVISELLGFKLKLHKVKL